MHKTKSCKSVKKPLTTLTFHFTVNIRKAWSLNINVYEGFMKMKVKIRTNRKLVGV